MTVAPAEGPILDRILSATFDIWHEGLDPAGYTRYYRGQLGTPWGSRRLRRWALLDGSEVLASAKTYEFDAALDGRSVRVLGLGAIFTQPEHRGRGYAARLIDSLIERAAADRFDLALLFSEIGAEYYERLGFTAVPRFDLQLRVREDPRRGAPAVLVRSGEDRDLASLAAIDAAVAAPYRFHLTRDRDLVHYGIAKRRLLAGLSPAGACGVIFDVAEEGAAAVAYVVISVRRGEWTIDAAGDRDPSGARVGAILQALIARNPAEARPAIAGWLPERLRPPQIELIGERPSRDVMMIRPLSANGVPQTPLGSGDICYWGIDRF